MMNVLNIIVVGRYADYRFVDHLVCFGLDIILGIFYKSSYSGGFWDDL